MEDTMMLKLLGMILLGILSGALSYYRKNYYVGVFNDILGKDEEESPAARVGRGFLYGFFFPIYFSLLLAGLAALVSFLIAAGIIAAIVFVLVWITEKLLPHEWFGNILIGLFGKFGLKGAPSTVQTPVETDSYASAAPAPPASQGQAATEGQAEVKPGAYGDDKKD
jgi:hypothetical protein